MENTIKLTVDAIIIIGDKEIVLVKRAFEPFKDHWALPGGIVEYGETVEYATVREVKEETGLFVKVEQLVGVYSRPDRDPRGHFVSVCFICSRVGGKIRTSEETKEVAAFSREEIDFNSLNLAFDHRKILEDAMILTD